MAKKYVGIYIPTHKICDAASKDEASKSLYGWQLESCAAEAWIRKLEKGQTIQPSAFSPKSDGTFTHARGHWNSTHFVCCDADNIKGIEFFDDGTDKNPDGIEAWTEPKGLSTQFPELADRVYAVGESVSSMSDDKPPHHRRYRLIFLFDNPIESESRYHQILLKLADEFPIIPAVERSPAQPVFGNARDGFKFHICENILKLADFPYQEPKQAASPQARLPIDETLEAYLRRHNINYRATKETNKFYLDCPYQDQHASGKNGPTDAYVFSDPSGWAFYCSHASCANRRTWEAFKTGNGIVDHSPARTKTTETSETVEPPPEPYRQTQEEVGDIPFPSEALEGTIFDTYEKAWAGKNETCPAYRFAELLCAFGARMGRTVRLEGVGYPTYPNWYIALIGDSYFSKKSQSTMYNMPKLVEDDETLLVESGLSTPEGLISMLSVHAEETAQEPRAIIKCDELKGLFVKSRMSGSEGLISKLTELYGCPDSVSVHTRKDALKVDYPTLSLMGNSTQDWLQSSVSRDDIGGGFINRFAFFLHEQQPWKPRTERPDTHLIKSVKDIINGVVDNYIAREVIFQLDDETGEVFDEWYCSTHQRLREDEEGVSISGARLTHHTMKLALLLSLTENAKGDHEIHLSAFQKACAVGEYWRKVNHAIFRNLAADKLTEQELRVLKALDDLGGQASKTALSNKIGRHHLSARDLQRILEALINNEGITATPNGRSTLLTRIG